MLAISFQHIILLMIILIPVLLGVGYIIYSIVKHTIKQAILDSREEKNQRK
ncbi:hypothetical protein CHRY9390_03141 [Chryseobacterium aquaeductus]|uniref:Uncharacterized protein n=1 Tax=Chryseobacterium aquaeductus TaxID=2675056 RepID=A0A9N8MJQ2_9FLAO|nr:hypothetical protein CHRY9390_03141 [Chryseobacterium potabilaquae]CAD7816299.1 hypothetical protein CHRY9390_03141 [Chryseobacterium aquaeductus]